MVIENSRVFVPRSKIIKDVDNDANGKPLIYEGSKRFYNPNQRLALTREHIEEIIRCKNDIVYFAENYCYIVSLDEGEHIIKLYEYQKRMLRHIISNRFTVNLQSRQTGKSTIFSIYVLWKSIFENDHASLMTSVSDENAKEIFVDRLINMYSLLPKFMKPTYLEQNKHKLVLTNGGKILSYKIKQNLGRGNTYNFILADEMAFYRQKLWEEWYTSTYPTLTSARITETKLAIVSTANGLNHFFELWDNANKGVNLYKPLKISWREKPWKSNEEMEKFKSETIAQIGLKRFQQEFDNEFLSASNALLSSEALTQIEPMKPKKFFFDNKLRIYQDAIPGHQYLLIADLGEGVGADSSVLNVIDISTKPFEQVAVYQDNKTSVNLIPDIMMKISKVYNNALIVSEFASAGMYVNNKLWNDLEYEYLYYDSDAGVPGIRTNKQNRQVGVLNLKELLENGMLTVNDSESLKELSNFIKQNDKYQGVEDHDDIVMTLVLFAYFITTDYCKGTYNIDWVENFRLQQVQKNFGGAEELQEAQVNEVYDFEGMMVYASENDETEDEKWGKSRGW